MLQLGIINAHIEKLKSIESLHNRYSFKNIDLDFFDVEVNNFDAFFIQFDSNIFDTICLLIKKRYPIFLDHFFNATAEEAFTLLQLSHEAETFVQINSPLKFRKFDEHLNNSFINSRYISVHRKIKNRMSDTLLQILFFEIDFITSKFQAQIKKIQSIYIPQNIENIHTIESRLEFNNGTIFHLFLTNLSEIEGYKIQLVENEGYLEIDILQKIIESSNISNTKTSNSL